MPPAPASLGPGAVASPRQGGRAHASVSAMKVGDSAKRTRVNAAAFLVLVSPEYQVQK